MPNWSILFFLFSSAFVLAQQKPLDAVTIQHIKEGVSLASKNTETISSNFTQEKEMSLLNDKVITTGKFYFKKEQFLRWEYIHPFAYAIAIRGNEISIRDEGVVRTFNTQSDRIFSEVNRIIIGSVNGTLLDDDSFTADFNQSNAFYIVALYPISVSLRESLDKILIYFNKIDFTVDKLELIEPAGDFTRITFMQKQLNKPIADEVFILR